MARIKYNPLLYPVQGKHYGYTFIRNHYGFSMMPAQRNKRTRWNRQAQRMQNIQKAIRNWRNMDASTQASWDTFAAGHPVSSKRSASVFLTGYQLFLKRNHYCFLNHGIESDFMMAPELTALPAGGPVFYLQAGINQVDLTELYISNFGAIPTVGQCVQFMAIPYSETSGQFFPAIHSTLEILATYLDGFFLSIEMPVNVAGIVYSVYLSKPLNRGYEYPGSKTRYMGCFTSKSFLGLSDTPDSYAGQAGKTPIVKVDETGLEWGSGGGGGLTCADLPACPTIISIFANLQILNDAVINLLFSSIPPISFGLLYNWYCTTNAAGFAPIGWHVPTLAEIQSGQAFLGGRAVAASPIMDKNLLYWNGPNSAATNSTKLNWRGAGNRLGTTGAFGSIKASGGINLADAFGASNCYVVNCTANSTIFADGTASQRTGRSMRFIKDTTVLSEGQSSTYIAPSGQIYRTICFNGQEWLADNWRETKYNDGSAIPEVTLAADWLALGTGAFCAYNNVWNNV